MDRELERALLHAQIEIRELLLDAALRQVRRERRTGYLNIGCGVLYACFIVYYGYLLIYGEGKPWYWIMIVLWVVCSAAMFWIGRASLRRTVDWQAKADETEAKITRLRQEYEALT